MRQRGHRQCQRGRSMISSVSMGKQMAGRMVVSNVSTSGERPRSAVGI